MYTLAKAWQEKVIRKLRSNGYEGSKVGFAKFLLDDTNLVSLTLNGTELTKSWQLTRYITDLTWEELHNILDT